MERPHERKLRNLAKAITPDMCLIKPFQLVPSQLSQLGRGPRYHGAEISHPQYSETEILILRIMNK